MRRWNIARNSNSASYSTFERRTVSAAAPEFVQQVTAVIAGRGDRLPSAPITAPIRSAREMGEAQHRQEVPVWEPDLCIECGKCMLVAHATIRAKVCKGGSRECVDRLQTVRKWRELPDHRYTIQVAVEDCTGCQLCVEVCRQRTKHVSLKALNMKPGCRSRQRTRRWMLLTLPEIPRNGKLTFGPSKTFSCPTVV